MNDKDKVRGIASVLQSLADTDGAERITLGKILARLGERSFALSVLIFALPNIIPLLPGLASLCAVPIFITGLQMALGFSYLRLPRWLANKSVSRQAFATTLARGMKILQIMERFIRPRCAKMTAPWAERLLGVIWMLLASVIVLPIPFGDPLPSFCLALTALAWMERDGLVLTAGAALSLATVYGMTFVIAKAVTLTMGAIAGLASR